MSTHEDRVADMRQDRADDELEKHAVVEHDDRCAWPIGNVCSCEVQA